MSSKWLLPIKLAWREQFPTWYSWIGFLIGIGLSFVIYYYSSKAFVPSAEFRFVKNVPDFFTYIILGEISLLIPMIIFHDGLESFKRWKDWGIWELLYFTPVSWIGILTSLLSGQLAIKLMILIINIIFAALIFKMPIGPLNLVLFIGWQLLSTFLLGGIFLTLLSIMVILKRGFKINSYITIVLSVLSGAYFPLDVFKNSSIERILTASPLSIHMATSRSLWAQGEFMSQNEFGLFMIWALFFWTVGSGFFYYVLKFSTNKLWD